MKTSAKIVCILSWALHFKRLFLFILKMVLILIISVGAALAAHSIVDILVNHLLATRKLETGL